MFTLGPLICPNPLGSMVHWRTFLTNSTRYNNCTGLNNYYMHNQRQYSLGVCLGQYREFGFVQGVNGFLKQVDSIGVHSCSRGDYRMWFKLELCCPGLYTMNPKKLKKI